MTKITNVFKKIRALFPSKLPVGMTEFEAWSDSIISLYDLATKDANSVKFTLSTIIMHLGPQTAYKSKFFFYLTLQTAAAKQIAGAAFTKIKEDEKARQLKALQDEAAKPTT